MGLTFQRAFQWPHLSEHQLREIVWKLAEMLTRRYRIVEMHDDFGVLRSPSPPFFIMAALFELGMIDCELWERWKRGEEG